MGLMYETPDRLSVFSIDPEDVRTGTPGAQFKPLTNAISLNIEALDPEQIPPMTGHEQVHYNLSRDMAGPTTDEFTEEVDDVLNVREEVRDTLNQKGYDLDLYKDKFGRDNFVTPDQMCLVTLAAEDTDLLMQVLDEGSPDDGLPMDAAYGLEREDDLFKKHYTSMRDRYKDVYYGGIVPLQEPLAYFAQFQISGMMEDCLDPATTRNITDRFNDRIEEDFPHRSGSYFGDKSMQEVEDVVREIFEDTVSRYKDHRLAGYGPAEASKEAVPESMEEIKGALDA